MKNLSESGMQKCCIYARYSSHAQRDVSIEQQVADCEAYCRFNNLEVVEVYADRHLTGTSDKRPQFQKMLRDSEKHRWSFVVTWKVDRFARNRYDSAMHKYRLKKHGVRVLYAKESIPDGPEGILLESILEGSAEYYSANLSQNVRRGMRYNALNCLANSGSFPYGYCKGPDGHYAVKEAEAEVVREIFRKVSEGTPFVEIANDLNGRGIKTGRGNLWNKGSFHTILKNESYIGVYHHSDVRIEGGVPAIVEKKLFLQVQGYLQKKKNPQGRHRENGEYLLTGKLRCGMCGAYMTGISGTGRHGDKHYYYVCQSKRKDHTCQKENVSREWIEGLVVKAAVEQVLRPDVIEWIADRVMDYQARESAGSQLEALRVQRSDAKKAIDNILKAIEAGIITASTKQRLIDLENEVSRLDNSIAYEEASLTHLERDQVIYILEKFCGGNVESQEYRRKIIDAFVSAVYLWDDHFRIAFNWSGKHSDIDMALVLNAEAVAGAEGLFKLSATRPQGSQTNLTAIYFVGPAFVLAMPLPER